ncbi:glutamate racemase [Paenibacillus whitsoniae]|uniref:Glutamate racemase n=1 Tax=Paenibacillus whitsoniae TaxID=2496558 RepID=A0A3S0BQQ3_9BACL|nr:glutamate racemase [Paenibacillus whitsoniae]RTE02866.1 glutamate racemase [Paenibacillus whitsoniae]
MKIGVFDSGIGGITVLHEAMRRLPREDFIYFADTLHVPYGTKPKEDVLQFVKASAETIVQHDVKALVIACNTATSIAINALRQHYALPIVGMEPAVKPAIEMNRASGKRVLVFATPLTLKESKYKALVSRVDDAGMVDSIPLPDLVRYCESLVFEGPAIRDYFAGILQDVDLSVYGTVVLGCTHYPFYRKLLSELLPGHIQIVDGSKGTVNRLIQLLQERGALGQGGSTDVTWLCSDNSPAYLRKMPEALAMLQRMEAQR